MGVFKSQKEDRRRSAYEEIVRTRKVSEEILAAHKFHDTIQGSAWFRNQSVSPGGWAMDYAAFYTVFRILENTRPLSIVEFGLGQMSKMLHQYGSHFPETQVVTVEHDREWADFICGQSSSIDITKVRFVERATDDIQGHPTLTYKDMDEVLSQKYDLIVVDGPLGQPRYSRPQIMKMIPSCLGQNWCIVMDDYDRPGEKETCEEVKKLLRLHDISFAERIYGSVKEHWLICSQNQNFLTSL